MVELLENRKREGVGTAPRLLTYPFALVSTESAMPIFQYSPNQFNTFQKKFWSRVAIHPDEDVCWEWQASRYPKGYGRVAFQGKTNYAHRIAWMLANGEFELPENGKVIRHSCDNPPCCNPKHLILGTQQENCQDREDRWRRSYRRITEERKSDVAILYLSGLSIRSIKKELGVSCESIYRVIAERGLPMRGTALKLETTAPPLTVRSGNSREVANA